MPDETPVPGRRRGIYQDWFDSRFRKPDGTPYGTRARQAITKKLRPPITKIGWSQTIDFDDGDECLREWAKRQQQQEQPRRGRGRPRTTVL